MSMMSFLNFLKPQKTADPKLHAQSRERWKNCAPDKGLTWGVDLDGNDFVTFLKNYLPKSTGLNLLEIGPGYGRITKSVMASDIAFNKYLGVDLSEKNINFLKGEIKDPRLQFQVGDAETFPSDFNFDLVYSTATFHHFYPDCGKALQHIAKKMNPGGRIIFDVHLNEKMSGTDQAHFESDGQTYVKKYTRKEIEELLTNAGLTLETVESVSHGDNRKRRTVVAKKA